MVDLVVMARYMLECQPFSTIPINQYLVVLPISCYWIFILWIWPAANLIWQHTLKRIALVLGRFRYTIASLFLNSLEF